MPAAGAAPARKGAARADHSLSTAPLPQIEGGWKQLPNLIDDNIDRFGLSGLKYRIINFVRRLAVASLRAGNGEWVTFTYKEFSDAGCPVTKQAIIDALPDLAEGEFPLIEVDVVSHKKRRYRLLLHNFKTRPTFVEKDFEKKDFEEQDAEEQDAEEIDINLIALAAVLPARSVARVTDKSPLLIPLKKKVNRLFVTGDAAVSYVHYRGGDIGVKVNGLMGTKPREAENRSVNLDPLREAIEPIFVRTFKKDLDDVFLSKIAEELGEATPGELVERIRVRAPKQSGLLLALARDVRKAHEAMDRHKRPAAAPPTPQKTFEAEQEGSGTPWDLIRRGARKKLTQQEYQNWLQQTRWVAHERGLLTIAVIDEVTAEFIASEYHDLLIGIGRDLGFTFTTIKCEVAS